MHQNYLAYATPIGYVAHMTGDAMLKVLGALANTHRLRIIAALHSAGRNYVSQLARDVGLSRPLLHMHLQRLQDAGLVQSKLELSASSKALSYFEVTEFFYELSPATIAAAVASLTLINTNPGDPE